MRFSSQDFVSRRSDREKTIRSLPIALRRDIMGPDPETALAALEAEARASKAFGADLDFDAVKWVIAEAKTTSSREEISLWFTCLPPPDAADKNAELRPALPPRFAIFAKSVIRLVEHTSHYEPPMYERLLRAFRCISEALAQRGAREPWDIRTEDLDEAERLANARYAENTVKLVKIDLHKIARVCDVYRLTWDDVQYEPRLTPSARPKAGGVDDPSLPTTAAISALAHIHAEATALPDIAMMCPVRVIQFTHLRGTEALQLGVDCELFTVRGCEVEAEEYDAAAPEVRKFGLRYYDVKAKGWGIKPVLAEAAPIVRDAIETARILSAPSRAVAQHYAAGMGAWLPAELHGRDLLSVTEAAEALWKTGHNSMNGWLKTNAVPVLEEAVSRADLQGALGRVVPHWPGTRALHAAIAELLGKRDDAAFSCSVLASVLPTSDLRRQLRKMDVAVSPRSIARVDLERAIMRLQPHGNDLPQPLDETLFLLPDNFFAANRPTFMPTSKPITLEQLRLWMTGSKDVYSVFRRYERREPNNDPIVVTPHAFRRWLITIAGSSRISLAQLREWTSHRSIDAVRGYVRETEAEIAAKVTEAYRLTGTERTPAHWR